ncbi:MAG: hypothetical protein M3O30_16275 [Planctomycetota bacterium]|nr:hypothetical protein [Planctomycetota bacterium]
METPRRQTRSGFTLLETALATIIVGVGVLAMVQLFAACTVQNVVGSHMTTAMLLANNIQEMMAPLPFNDPSYGPTYFGPEPGEAWPNYNDVDDFDGLVFNPPIDSFKKQIPALSQYTQKISVMPVLPNQLSGNTNESAPTIAKSTYTGAVRVRVHVYYQPTPGQPAIEVYSMSWIRVDR